ITDASHTAQRRIAPLQIEPRSECRNGSGGQDTGFCGEVGTGRAGASNADRRSSGKTVSQSAGAGSNIASPQRPEERTQGGAFMAGRWAAVAALAGFTALAVLTAAANPGAAESPVGDRNAEPAPFD